ncbi:Modification methylase HhaI [compost metagenome]
MIRVFESFAGYGSLTLALDELNIEYELVGSSEIDADAIIAYGAIKGYDLMKFRMPSEIVNGLKVRGIVLKDYNSLRARMVYNACLGSNNFGDITKIVASNVPSMDLFSYTFPCTTISKAGLKTGLKEGSDTKSSLLWYCRDVIFQHKPKYLFMENVIDLLDTKFRDDFDAWLEWLEDLGYSNFYMKLSADDFGVPQSRERLIMISVLDEHFVYQFPQRGTVDAKLIDYIDTDVINEYSLTPAEKLALEEKGGVSLVGAVGVAYNPCSREFRGFKQACPTLCARDYKGPKIVAYSTPKGVVARRLSSKEYWRLMGVKESYYAKCVQVGLSNSALYKLAGNSVVVHLIVGVLGELFKDYKNKKDNK